MNTRNTSENELIRRIRAIGRATVRRNSAVRLGIGDDAALFSPRHGYETILTCDWFLEGTHFLRDKHPADSVGWKCLARALSDIAAMGGEPRCFLLSLALPETHIGRWLNEFLAGLRRAARKFKCPLAGGDTTRRREILVNVTVVGEVRSGRELLRSGALPGDIIYVSGRLGEAQLGLQRLRRLDRVAKDDPALTKHLYPEPRIALGRWLADHRIATAMMDLSDGLSTDLPRLCASEWSRRSTGCFAHSHRARPKSVRPRKGRRSRLRTERRRRLRTSLHCPTWQDPPVTARLPRRRADGRRENHAPTSPYARPTRPSRVSTARDRLGSIQRIVRHSALIRWGRRRRVRRCGLRRRRRGCCGRLGFALGGFVFGWCGVGCVHVDGVVVGLLLERDHVCEFDFGHTGQSGLHELQPDGQRGASAGFLFTQRNLLVVETDPHSGCELRREADEPGVGVILRRAGLSR